MPIYALKKLLPFLKRHWKAIVLIGGLGLLYFLYVTQESAWISKYKKLDEIHQVEISQIEHVRDAEKIEHQKIEAELKDQLNEIQQKYEQQLAELRDQRKKAIVKIVKLYGKDPDRLADELSKTMDFRVIR